MEGAEPPAQTAPSGESSAKEPLLIRLDDPITQWATRNPAIAVSLVGFFLVVIEVLGITGWSPAKALAIVGAADTAKVVFAVAVSSGPLLLPPMSLLFLVWDQELRSVDARGSLVGTAGILLAFFAVVASPVFEVMLYVALYLVADVLPSWRTRRAGRPVRGFIPVGRRRTSFFLFVALSAALVYVETPTPWMATEVVSFTGSQPVVGFVVGTSGNQVVVLTDPAKEILVIPQADIARRSMCRRNEWWGLSSLSEILSKNVPATCPSP
jgi:hypothetical protein